jgi:CheY-like chemotaxis protein
MFFSSKPKQRIKPLVLHTDDEEINRDVMQMLLNDYGVDGLAATNAREAIKLARKNIPDLIILDVNMPGMDGIEACRNLKADPATKIIPIVMLTALSLMKDVERAFAEGANDYLTKPVDTKALYSALTRWLPKPASGGQNLA